MKKPEIYFWLWPWRW